jgi:phage regulator Rha-like protein
LTEGNAVDKGTTHSFYKEGGELKVSVPSEIIEKKILLVRGEKVMLDADLAELYGVRTSHLNKAVKRNIDRFPHDFMFQLSQEEADSLRFQIGMSKETGRGGRRYLPYVFTEQGVAMLSSVLNSERAVKVNIEIMRAFVRLRQMLASNAELARKLEALEKRYDAQFRVVFDAIRQLMTPPETKKKPAIGFRGVKDA